MPLDSDSATIANPFLLFILQASDPTSMDGIESITVQSESVPGMMSGAINSPTAAVLGDNNNVDENSEHEIENIEVPEGEEENRDEDMVSLQMLEDHSSLLSDKQRGKYHLYHYPFLIDADNVHPQENSALEIILAIIIQINSHKNLSKSFVNLSTRHQTSTTNTHVLKRISFMHFI